MLGVLGRLIVIVVGGGCFAFFLFTMFADKCEGDCVPKYKTEYYKERALGCQQAYASRRASGLEDKWHLFYASDYCNTLFDKSVSINVRIEYAYRYGPFFVGD